MNPSDPLNTKEIDTFLAQVRKLEEDNKKLVAKTNGTIEPKKDKSMNTAQIIPAKAQKYVKWAVIAGAGYALYSVLIAGDEEKS